METNYTITITELKFNEVGKETQDNMIAEINDKAQSDSFPFDNKGLLDGMHEPNDFLFYGAIISKGDIQYLTNDVWLDRDSLFQSLEQRLKRIDHGIEPIFFSSDEKEITKKQIEYWLGSDQTKEKAIDCIFEVANDNYKPQQLKQDILDYAEIISSDENKVVNDE